MNSYLALILGAVLGSSLRYFINLLNYSIAGLPVTTILVNISGSELAGLFLNKVNGTNYIFLYIGLFGSFTTLSSFNIDMFNLLSDRLFIKAFIFFLLNIVLSFIFFYLFYLISIKLEN
jgi:CrcB protein